MGRRASTLSAALRVAFTLPLLSSSFRQGFEARRQAPVEIRLFQDCALLSGKKAVVVDLGLKLEVQCIHLSFEIFDMF
jgi:hypothetical protein